MPTSDRLTKSIFKLLYLKKVITKEEYERIIGTIVFGSNVSKTAEEIERICYELT